MQEMGHTIKILNIIVLYIYINAYTNKPGRQFFRSWGSGEFQTGFENCQSTFIVLYFLEKQAYCGGFKLKQCARYADNEVLSEGGSVLDGFYYRRSLLSFFSFPPTFVEF